MEWGEKVTWFGPEKGGVRGELIEVGRELTYECLKGITSLDLYVS